MAAEERLELPLTESKSVVLPLHYSAILSKNKNEMLNKIRQNFIFDLALPYHLAIALYIAGLLDAPATPVYYGINTLPRSLFYRASRRVRVV